MVPTGARTLTETLYYHTPGSQTQYVTSQDVYGLETSFYSALSHVGSGGLASPALCVATGLVLDIFGENLAKFSRALLWVSLLAALIVDVRYAETGSITFVPFVITAGTVLLARGPAIV